jgi:hypothetical protein
MPVAVVVAVRLHQQQVLEDQAAEQTEEMLLMEMLP